jgi:hypothetical protein
MQSEKPLAADHSDQQPAVNIAVTREQAMANQSTEPLGFLRGGYDALMHIVNGAVGTAQAYFETDLPPEEVIKKRYDICAACEQNGLGQCLACKCFVGSLIRINSSVCPLNLWTANNAIVPPS